MHNCSGATPKMGTRPHFVNSLSVMRTWFIRQREAPLSEQVGQLKRERDAATNRLALLAGELAQLKSSFETPPGDDLLDRYQIVPSASLSELGRPANSDWVITLKSPQDEGNWAVSPNGSAAFVDNPQMTILAPAMKAAMDAAPVINGARRLDIHQKGST